MTSMTGENRDRTLICTFSVRTWKQKALVLILILSSQHFVSIKPILPIAFSEVSHRTNRGGRHNRSRRLDGRWHTCPALALGKGKGHKFAAPIFVSIQKRHPLHFSELCAENGRGDSGISKGENVLVVDKTVSRSRSGRSNPRINHTGLHTGNKQAAASKEIEQKILRLGRQGRTHDALEVYYSLWSETNLNSHSNSTTRTKIHPKTRHLNMALDACARAQPARLSEALNIFHNGLQRGLSPNVYTFGSLMHTCARSVDGDPTSRTNLARDEREEFVVSNALRMLSDMSSKYGVIPNQVIWSTAILACRHRPYTALGLLHFAQENYQISFNAVAYNTLLSAFANRVASRNDPETLEIAESLVKEMEVGQKIVRIDLESLSRYSPSDVKKSSSSQHPAAQPNVSSLQSLDSSRVTLATMDEMKKLTKTVSRTPLIPEPDSISYATLMLAYERQSKWRSILKVAREAEKTGRNLDGLALTTALNACQKLGLADEALHFLRAMKSISQINEQEKIEAGAKKSRLTRGRERKGAKQDLEGPDAVAYGLAIEACARAGRWEKGLEILDDMKRSLSQNRGWTKDSNAAVPYTAAIDGCAEAGEWKMAIKLLHDMIHLDQISPTVYTYSAVIHACAIAAGSSFPGDDEMDLLHPMDAALSILNQMKGGSFEDSGIDNATPPNNTNVLECMVRNLSPPRHSDVKPNIVTYNSALQACAEGLSLTHAFHIMKEIKRDNIEPTIVTFGSLITACERVGNVSAMEKAFKYLDDHYPHLAGQTNEVIYGAALSCCRKAKEPEKAYRIFQKMLKSQIKPNAATCNTVLATLIDGMSCNQDEVLWSREQMLERSVLIFKAMEGSPRFTSEKPSSASYVLLIRGHVQNDQPEEAEAVLRKLKFRFPQYRPRVELYTSIVTSYERAKRPLKALELMEEMRAEGYDFYNLHMLDSAFKRLLKLTNQIAKGGSNFK